MTVRMRWRSHWLANDYSEDGTAPYGYSYLADGKVWICMEVPHALGDYIEIELDTQ